MPIKSAFFTAALLGFGAFCGPAFANLIVNGDFETDLGLHAPADWTVGPGSEIWDLTGADYIPCCGTFGTPAELANHFASFGPGDVPNVSSLTQTVVTPTAGSYALTFDAGALGAGQQDLVASVYSVAGNHLLTTATITTTANDNLAFTFTGYGLDFSAASGASYYVSFDAVGPGISIDPVLDNVSVSSVPEPST